jgi:hypothetical protein
MSATIAPQVAAPTAGDAAKRAWVSRVLGLDITAPGASPGTARAGEAAREIAGGLGSLTMAFRKARLSWGTARGEARSAIAGLQARLREVLAEEPDFAALDAEIAKFDGIIVGLDDRLETTLDKAMNLTDPDGRAELKKQAVGIIGEYTTFIESHPFLRKIDGNEFMPVAVFSVLSGELRRMATELA